MDPNLHYSHRILTRFEQPLDLLEKSSDFCLHFLRTAIGTHYNVSIQSDNSEQFTISDRVTSCVLRIFAGLLALTLWLPITLVGIGLCYLSKSHHSRYQQLFQPSQKPSNPTNVPEPELPTADDNDDSDDDVSHIEKSQKNKVLLEKAALKKMQAEDSKLTDEQRADLMQKAVALASKEGKLNRVPNIVKWAKQLLSEDVILRNCFPLAWSKQNKHQFTPREQYYLMRAVLEEIGNNGPLLCLWVFYTDDYYEAKCMLLSLFSLEQIHAFFSYLKEANFDTKETYCLAANLRHGLNEKTHTVMELAERTAAIPLALGQDPYTWATQGGNYCWNLSLEQDAAFLKLKEFFEGKRDNSVTFEGLLDKARLQHTEKVDKSIAGACPIYQIPALYKFFRRTITDSVPESEFKLMRHNHEKYALTFTKCFLAEGDPEKMAESLREYFQWEHLFYPNADSKIISSLTSREMLVAAAKAAETADIPPNTHDRLFKQLFRIGIQYPDIKTWDVKNNVPENDIEAVLEQREQHHKAIQALLLEAIPIKDLINIVMGYHPLPTL